MNGIKALFNTKTSLSVTDNTVPPAKRPMAPWDRVLAARKYAFAALVALGLFLEIYVHLFLNISIVYTHFFYLVIVLAGLWYQRKAIWFALLFGALHVAVTYIDTGVISVEAVLRAVMFVLVAIVVGEIVERMEQYRKDLEEQYQKLGEAYRQLSQSEKAYEMANKKLNLLNSVTRHDIQNQLTVVGGYLLLAGEECGSGPAGPFLQKAEAASLTISRQIAFTKLYQDTGIHAPQYQNVTKLIAEAAKEVHIGDISLEVRTENLEIFADPLLGRVFSNLIDNSVRHAGKGKRITFSYRIVWEGLVLTCEDDGEGIPPGDKERIFERGFGKNTGFGLFLTREILAITGLSIRETGIYGEGARFEITSPPGAYRLTDEGNTRTT